MCKEKEMSTLLIGLGGTGRKAADLIHQRIEADQSAAPFLIIDTDEQEETGSASIESESDK